MLDNSAQTDAKTDVSPVIEESNSASVTESVLKAKVAELESELFKLQGDFKATIFRQREIGASAGETVKQIEAERDA